MTIRELNDPEFYQELLEAVAGPGAPPGTPTYGTEDPLLGLVAPDVEEEKRTFRHRLLPYLRQSVLPTTFCVGCGGGTVLNAFAHAIDEMHLDPREMVCVTGIGCSSWIPSPYFYCDTLHTTHGRAVAFACGVKIMKPDMKVIIIAGDGDLAGIGGNHLIHAARRNIDLSVFLVRPTAMSSIRSRSPTWSPPRAAAMSLAGRPTTSSSSWSRCSMPFRRRASASSRS
jgi:hypothetical protein